MSQILPSGRTLLAATLVATAGLAASLTGCARGVTYDEAYGRPDATDWTYFNVPARQVVGAISQFYSDRGVATEQTRDEAGGIVMTFANRRVGGETAEILVQATTVEGFEARAQLYPGRRPVPRELETFVTRGQ